MFNRQDKKLSKAKPLNELMAIVTPQQVLAEPKRAELLQKIFDASALETSRFESLSVNLIHNLIQHCQLIPETNNSYYSGSGGLIDHALNRTEAAVTIFREFILRESEADLSEEQKLWVYALFSAAMLQGMGKLYMDYHVELYDANGQFLKQWSPLLESITEAGSLYDFDFLKEGEADMRRRVNLLMARRLMPLSGFSWIISDPRVFSIWLALLNEDARSAGTLGAILIRADAIALQRFFTEYFAKYAHRTRGNRLGTFVDTLPETIDKERLIGGEFLKWFTEKLAVGDLIVNQVPLLAVPGGLLMSAEVFQRFMVEHPEFKNWQAIQRAFLSLGLHQIGANGNVTGRFEHTDTNQMLTGVVFADYAMALPEKVSFYNSQTGKVTPMNAVELIYQLQTGKNMLQQAAAATSPSSLMHLSVNGTWTQAPATTAPTSSNAPGSNKRG